MTDLNSSLKHACVRLTATVAAFAAGAAVRLPAQQAPEAPVAPAAMYAPRFNMVTYAGASIPTGTLRDSFDSGFLLGAQGTYDLSRHVGVLGSFDWTNPDTKLVPTDSRANIYQVDLGLEVGGARGNTRKWALRPFVDLGGGVRSYNYSSSTLNDHTGGAGFAALGTDVALGRSSLRLAATDNVFSYESPMEDATHSTRNEVGLSIGVGFHP
jgi:hypothetical protein